MKAPPALHSLFKRQPIQTWDNIDPIFGDVFYDLNGVTIHRTITQSFAGLRLPALLNNSLSTIEEPTPETSLASNLPVLLTGESLQGLRHSIFPNHRPICELCGTKSPHLELHESWNYHYPSPQSLLRLQEEPGITLFGVQQLQKLLLICDACHKCFHLSRAQLDGTLPQTIHRLQALNHWDHNTIQTYLTTREVHLHCASKLHWMLDFQKIRHPHGGIILRQTWARYEFNPNFIGAHSNSKIHSLTRILGIPWRLQSEQAWNPRTRID